MQRGRGQDAADRNLLAFVRTTALAPGLDRLLVPPVLLFQGFLLPPYRRFVPENMTNTCIPIRQFNQCLMKAPGNTRLSKPGKGAPKGRLSRQVLDNLPAHSWRNTRITLETINRRPCRRQVVHRLGNEDSGQSHATVLRATRAETGVGTVRRQGFRDDGPRIRPGPAAPARALPDYSRRCGTRRCSEPIAASRGRLSKGAAFSNCTTAGRLTASKPGYRWREDSDTGCRASIFARCS